MRYIVEAGGIAPSFPRITNHDRYRFSDDN
jgi:hypothetical protein